MCLLLLLPLSGADFVFIVQDTLTQSLFASGSTLTVYAGPYPQPTRLSISCNDPGGTLTPASLTFTSTVTKGQFNYSTVTNPPPRTTCFAAQYPNGTFAPASAVCVPVYVGSLSLQFAPTSLPNQPLAVKFSIVDAKNVTIPTANQDHYVIISPYPLGLTAVPPLDVVYSSSGELIFRIRVNSSTPVQQLTFPNPGLYNLTTFYGSQDERVTYPLTVAPKGGLREVYLTSEPLSCVANTTCFLWLGGTNTTTAQDMDPSALSAPLTVELQTDTPSTLGLPPPLTFTYNSLYAAIEVNATAKLGATYTVTVRFPLGQFLVLSQTFVT